MAEVLGLGMTHYPLLAGRDEMMAGLLRGTLTDPDIPEAEKDPANWSDAMRAEWGDDQGRATAPAHRQALVDGLARCRERLDAFAPDVVVVWGDDQYENFREEVVPPFCVLAYDDIDVHPFEFMNSFGNPNAWGRPDDMSFVLRGNKSWSRHLADQLIGEGFDMAYSYRKREGTHFPHSIANTQLFLDYEHAGTAFPYPIIPITVNCYGQHAVARKGGLARFADIATEELDPSGPSPARCMDLGAAVARVVRGWDMRVAFVASSSWSHAFLNDKDWHLRPDTASDQELYDAFVAGDRDRWRRTSSAEIVRDGQHEMLNWFCLVGAADELGLDLRWSEMVATDVFNSNKVFAIFDRDGDGSMTATTVDAAAIGQAARRLAEAERTRIPCAPVRDLVGATDVDAAYAVQSIHRDAALAAGRRVVGRKIGLTAPAVQRQLGVDRPDFGYLYDDMDVSGGAPVATGRLLQPKIEAEVAFRLGADLDGAIDPDTVRAAAGRAVAALEIVDSRIAGWDITFGDTVADNASSGLFVLGDGWVDLTEDTDLTAVAMALHVDGEQRSEGSGAACLGDPFAALAWLAEASLRHGDPLRAGQVVLSGALGPMVPVGPGAAVHAEITGLGAVSCTFARSEG